jgi:hypothetical protein
MSEENIFNGFMPTVTDVTISKEIASITSEGNITNVHCVTIKTKEKEYVFSIYPEDMKKLYFLILKTLIG